MAIAVKFDLEVHQLDVINTFLNGKIYTHKSIYIELPDEARMPGKVAQLNRVLYPLKDSPLL